MHVYKLEWDSAMHATHSISGSTAGVAYAWGKPAIGQKTVGCRLTQLGRVIERPSWRVCEWDAKDERWFGLLWEPCSAEEVPSEAMALLMTIKPA